MPRETAPRRRKPKACKPHSRWLPGYCWTCKYPIYRDEQPCPGKPLTYREVADDIAKVADDWFKKRSIA